MTNMNRTLIYTRWENSIEDRATDVFENPDGTSLVRWAKGDEQIFADRTLAIEAVDRFYGETAGTTLEQWRDSLDLSWLDRLKADEHK